MAATVVTRYTSRLSTRSLRLATRQTAMIENGFVHIPETAPLARRIPSRDDGLPRRASTTTRSTRPLSSWTGSKRQWPHWGNLRAQHPQKWPKKLKRAPEQLEQVYVRLKAAPPASDSVQNLLGAGISTSAQMAPSRCPAADAKYLIPYGWTKARRIGAADDVALTPHHVAPGTPPELCERRAEAATARHKTNDRPRRACKHAAHNTRLPIIHSRAPAHSTETCRSSPAGWCRQTVALRGTEGSNPLRSLLRRVSREPDFLDQEAVS